MKNNFNQKADDTVPLEVLEELSEDDLAEDTIHLVSSRAKNKKKRKIAETKSSKPSVPPVKKTK